MTHRPAALVTLVLVSTAGTAAAEPCAPRAELGGDRAAVERVAGELRELGVSIAPATARCPSVQAMVELDRGGGIAVAVRGASHGSEGRVMTDAALAAAWIDSWARDDLEVASWSAGVAAPAAPLVVAPSDVPPTPISVATPLLERLAISGSYEQSWTNDGSAWTGGSVSGCVRVGRFCLGARVRAAFEPQLTSGITAAARSDLSAFAIGSIPIDVGQMTIAPELGIGFGRFSTRRLEGCSAETPPTCATNEPDCVMPPAVPCDGTNGTDPSLGQGTIYVGDGLDESSYSPRFSVALRIAIPLFKYVWLDGLASLTMSPLHHAGSYGPIVEPVSGVSSGDVTLPGEPEDGLQLGVGLRLGAP